MASSRIDEWEQDYETYSESQVEGVITECGVDIVSETNTHFLCYCPFHNNTDSPAFAIDKEIGKWICFSCDVSGVLETLPKKLLKLNIFQSKRLILKYKDSNIKSLSERRLEREKKRELPTFDKAIIDRMAEQLDGSPAQSYMRDRGFNDDTLEKFQVGYSKAKNLVAVPMYAVDGTPVGIVGRRLPPVDHSQRFYNSPGLPKRLIPWNIHNAKKHGDTGIITEASFDGMKIDQAGFPNVLGLLGGYVTPWHYEVIDRHFSTLILMTDFDKKRFDVNCKRCKSKGNRICTGHRAGRDFGRTIINQFPHKKVLWVAYDDTCVYPNGAKDATDMTDDEIRQCLKNTISNYEYRRWNIED